MSKTESAEQQQPQQDQSEQQKPESAKEQEPGTTEPLSTNTTPPTTPARDPTQISKFMSLVLRHKPEAAKLALDSHGWAKVDELLLAINRKYPQPRAQPFTIDDIKSIVQNCAKQRFLLSDDGARIRANQGHSLQSVDLELKPIVIPDGLQLYHGTSTRFIDSIAKTGLSKQNRQHVHLSSDRATALSVGQRHGKPVILMIDMVKLKKDKLLVYQSENGVHLMESVPVAYLQYEGGAYLSSTGITTPKTTNQR